MSPSPGSNAYTRPESLSLPRTTNVSMGPDNQRTNDTGYPDNGDPDRLTLPIGHSSIPSKCIETNRDT